MKKEALNHPFPPVYNSDSVILILGTFPSLKSRENEFYYGHPQNRFWYLIADIFNEPTPETIDEKKLFLLRNKIALWDVLESCEIAGSADNTITLPVVNNLNPILQEANIKAIYTNGKKAKELYDRYIFTKINIKASDLPSTSPANRRFTMDGLKAEWGKIKNSSN